MRLWILSENSYIYNLIKIAKIELVGNEWQYLGNVYNEDLGEASYNGTLGEDDEEFIIDENITIQVINSDENAEYISPEGLLGEYDEYGGRYTKEQSLVVDFSNLYDDDFDTEGGIDTAQTIFKI